MRIVMTPEDVMKSKSPSQTNTGGCSDRFVHRVENALRIKGLQLPFRKRLVTDQTRDHAPPIGCLLGAKQMTPPRHEPGCDEHRRRRMDKIVTHATRAILQAPVRALCPAGLRQVARQRR